MLATPNASEMLFCPVFVAYFSFSSEEFSSSSARAVSLEEEVGMSEGTHQQEGPASL